MKRRGFLQALLCVPAVAALPALASHPRPWEIPGVYVADRSFDVVGGIYVAEGVTMERCHIRVRIRPEDKYIFHSRGKCRMRDCVIQGTT